MKLIKNFFILFFSLGYPIIPLVGIPIAFFVMFFNLNILNLFYRRNKKLIFYLFLTSFLYVLLSLIVSSALVDFLFSIKMLIKIILGFIIGIIVANSIIESPKSLFYWIIIQLVLVISSTFNESIYKVLLNFISIASKGTFENIYGLRSLGFGIYHVDGAITIVLMSFLYIFSTNSRKNIFSYLSILVSSLISRSALIAIIIFGGIRKPLIILLLILFLIWISNYVTYEYGSLYQSMELFRNIALSGELKTHSTNANLRMFTLPTDIYSYFHGYGYFFDGNRFFGSTDLGWFRMLLYGGIPMIIIFLTLNLLIVFGIVKKNLMMKISMLILFVVMNFKGLYVISFVSTVFLLSLNRKIIK